MKVKRNEEIARRIANREPYKTVGRDFGITKQRVEQIIRTNYPHLILPDRKGVMARRRVKKDGLSRNKRGKFDGRT